MSHYIQDNCAVVHTADNKLILFIKGGDNNVSSSTTNRRCTSWHLQGIYNSEEDYNAMIEEFVTSDMSGGSWQFKSYKDTLGYGHPSVERLIFQRFDNALKKAMQTSWSIQDVTVENVYTFEKDLISLFKENSFAVTNQDGEETDLGFIWSYKNEVAAEESAIKRLNHIQNIPKPQGYKELVLKYGTLSRTELLNDFYFIIGFAKIKKRYNGVVSFLENFRASENTKNFNFALFSNIFSYKHNVKQLLQSWNISSFIGVYPSCFETLIILESFKKMVDDLIANADEYDTKTYSKNKEILFNADYKQLRKNLAETIASQDAKAKDVFIESFNSIVSSCWYKNTYEKVPLLIEKLDMGLKKCKAGVFQLKDCFDTVDGISFKDFQSLKMKYDEQHQKNKKAIVQMVNYIVFELSDVFKLQNKLHILEEYCHDFNINKDNKNSDAPAIVTEDTNYSQEQLQAFASGSLF